MPAKHALVIGINDYKFMPAKYQLGGCVNDAKLIKQNLIHKFQFPEANVITLYDSSATKDNILKAMDDAERRLAKDDIFVFHFSGHGHQCRIKTELHDEGSGKLNCILPHDDAEPVPNSDEVIYREIREDVINQWLQKIARKTKHTTLIFDACHSATITRSSDTEEYKARFIPESARRQVISLSRGSTTDEQSRSSARTTTWLTLSQNYVVISGCRDTQQSKEIFFREGNQRFKHGVLTYALHCAFFDAKPGTTYRDVFEQVSANVLAWSQDQHPQIEGTVDKELFGTNEIEPLNFVSVIDVQGTKITLAGGAAHGVREGTQWDIYKPYTKKPTPEALVGKLTITQVDGLTSHGHLQDRNVPHQSVIEVGSRCVAHVTNRVAQALAIHTHIDNLPLQNKLINLIKRSRLLEYSDSSTLSDIKSLSFAALDDVPSEYRIGIKADAVFPVIGFATAQDQLVMPLHSQSTRHIEHLLIDNLEKVAKYQNVLTLHNPASSLAVEFNLYRRLPDDTLQLVNGGDNGFDERAPFVLELKNKSPDKTVFFNILWLSANREIMHFYPPRKASEELSPGVTVRIGDGRNKLSASLSKDFFADIGSDSIKVFFTSHETDFRFLNQSGVRSNDAQANVVSELQDAVGEATTDQQATVSDWQAITRSIVLYRKVI